MLTRDHKLLTKQLALQLPPLYAQDGKGADAIIYAHYFSPYTNWDWYALEYDGEDTFFGYVCGFEKELGYFSLSELNDAVVYVGDAALFAVERDVYWEPVTLGKVKGAPC